MCLGTLCMGLLCIAGPFGTTILFTVCSSAVLFTIYPPLIYSCNETTNGYHKTFGYYKLYQCDNKTLVDGYIIAETESPYNESYAVYNFWIVTNFFWLFTAVALFGSRWIHSKLLIMMTMLPWVVLGGFIICSDCFFMFQVIARYTSSNRHRMYRVVMESFGMQEVGYRTKKLKICETLDCVDVSVYKMSNIAYRCIAHILNSLMVVSVTWGFFKRLKE